ncbi:flagellar biosynthesis anti-sigma factor FlgM [Eubacteriales bacterium mix99]|jgi:flagellar biosynthesis anti-sigma factor FlgM
MRINRADYADHVRYVNQACQKEKEKESRLGREADTSAQKDQITLSKTSRDVRKFVEMADQAETKDSGKVDRIRRALENGDYKVSPEELADAILYNISEQNGGGEK